MPVMHEVDSVTPALRQTIEDAVLFGHTRDLNTLLDMVSDDEGFPSDLRDRLEGLYYFRQYYGQGGELEPVQPAERLEISKTDSAWSHSILQMVQDRSAGGLKQARAS